MSLTNQLAVALRQMASICANYRKVTAIDVQKMASQAATEIDRLEGDNHALAEQVRDFKSHYAADHAEVERLRTALQKIAAPPEPTQLQEAHKALWEMAEDGWMFHGIEGMDEAQKLVWSYTLRYPKGSVHEPK